MRGPTLAVAISIPMTSSMSAVHNVPLVLRRPLGALSPFTQFASITLPSELSFTMRPFPSRSPGMPTICDEKMKPDAESTNTLSGVSMPSVAVHLAGTSAFGDAIVGAGVADAAGSFFSVGEPPQPERTITRMTQKIFMLSPHCSGGHRPPLQCLLRSKGEQSVAIDRVAGAIARSQEHGWRALLTVTRATVLLKQSGRRSETPQLRRALLGL